MTAFGPFADTVEIDVDALSAPGLFLIQGATGAGKTSLLDAVCFALYGSVPGARPDKSLRSDHAGPRAVPEVTLDFTACGRRFRVVRNPAFVRPPKRSGAKMQDVPTKVTLDEFVAGAWVPRSHRAAEVGETIQSVLGGMGVEQFNRVVMLPQGDFVAFLRAKPEERRRLLAKLFDVSRFTDIEGWFDDRRRAAEAEVGTLREDLGRSVAALSEALADEGDTLDTTTNLSELDPHDLPAALDAAVARLEERASRMLAGRDTAEGERDLADSAHATGVALKERQTKGLQARATLARLDADADHVATQERAVDAGTRAAAVLPQLADLARHARSVAAAEDALAVAVTRLGDLGVSDASPEALTLAREHRAIWDEPLAKAQRLEESLSTDADAAATLRTRLEASLAEDEAHAQHVADLGVAIAAADEQVSTAREAAMRVADLRAHHEQANARHAAARTLAELRREQGDLDERIAAARERAAAAKERALDLRERRLDGMAAELAAALQDGDPCAVCGATEHPAPAVRADVVSADDVAAAEKVHQAREREHQDLRERRRDVVVRIEQLVGTLDGHGEDVADLAAARELAARELADVRALAKGLDTAVARHSGRLEERERLEERQQARAQRRAVDEAELSRLSAAVEAATDAVSSMRREHAAQCPWGVTSVVEALIRHRALAEAETAHAGVLERLSEAQDLRASARIRVDEAIAEAGFPDDDSVRAATLSRDDLAALAAEVRRHHDERLVASAVLEEPDTADALAAAEPDLPALAARREEARATARAAADADGRARHTLEAVTRLRPTVVATVDALGPAAEQSALVQRLADAVKGKGGDNTLRMQLSSFVLAARLERVAELANERLAVMGDGRYRLEHSDALAKNGARSGLGLQVQDLWTGAVRDTTTLSGGESFMASLALALGLAEAVREEAGGFDLQTLFIDEGFGTLDDESLEQVMGVLDSLREGGRAVGVVSHVAELRTRIPAQVIVRKSESGSSVEVTGPANAHVA
ncbi:AAA family ATPase [Janibacter sp. G56]|uniref:AAA family ATPase n=1 Tax=Janibacter sp. G56 TaxID=3418717 RepID=UPI003CFD237D